MTPPAPVGARLEAAPTPPPLWQVSANFARLAVLLLASVAVHAVLVANTRMTARDSIGFAQLALLYESPELANTGEPFASRLDVMLRAKPPHPPGYPVAVLVASKVVRAVGIADSKSMPERMLLSAQLASCLAGVLLVFPSYALGRRLFGPFGGFGGALLIQLLPVVARVTSDGLTEAWYLLFTLSGVFWATRGVELGRRFDFALAGVAAGLAYLVRPEGLVLVPAVLAALGTRWLVRQRGFGATALDGAACLVGFALVAGPYMAAIGGVTLKPGGQVIAGQQALAPAPVPAVGPTLLAANYAPTDGLAKRLSGAFLKEAAKAGHFGVFGFGLVGLVLAVRPAAGRPQLLPSLWLAAGFAALLAVQCSRAAYTSERHTLGFVAMLAVYAPFAAREVPRLFSTLPGFGVFARPVWAYLNLAAMVISCLPVTFKPLHEGRLGHKVIGEYLREIGLDKNDVLIDPYTFAEYYSGRSLYGSPPDPPNPRYRYAIIEEGEPPHNTPTRLQAALNVRDDGKNPPEVLKRWDDPNEARAGRQIILYRQRVR